MIDASFRPIEHVAAVASAAAPAPGPAVDGFAGALAEAVQRVEGYAQTADAAVNRFLGGQQEELHTVAVATQQAELAFDLFLQVQNKVVQAYQEVMRMQL